jgi:hypothetical protein
MAKVAIDLSQDFTALQQGNMAKSLGGQGFLGWQN